MKKDPRLDNVEIEWVPWTEETWDRHVEALAAVVDEVLEEEERRHGGMHEPADRSGSHTQESEPSPAALREVPAPRTVVAQAVDGHGDG